MKDISFVLFLDKISIVHFREVSKACSRRLGSDVSLIFSEQFEADKELFDTTKRSQTMRKIWEVKLHERG